MNLATCKRCDSSTGSPQAGAGKAIFGGLVDGFIGEFFVVAVLTRVQKLGGEAKPSVVLGSLLCSVSIFADSSDMDRVESFTSILLRCRVNFLRRRWWGCLRWGLVSSA